MDAAELETRQLIERNYPRIATDLLEPLLTLLQMSRSYCGGDVDKFMIILLVGLRSTKHPEFRARTPDELLSEEIAFPGLGTNVRSISESLGIPRETVRRKVRELLEAGWLVRPDGKLYFTARAHQDLGPVRRELGVVAARYCQLVSALRG